jgi:ABC-type polysaccharide/polyol phosphate transport system ATPase subunit
MKKYPPTTKTDDFQGECECVAKERIADVVGERQGGVRAKGVQNRPRCAKISRYIPFETKRRANQPSMNAIEVRDLSKKFRKLSLRRNYRTFKDIFTGYFIPGNGGAPKPNDPSEFAALKNVSFTIPKGETWGMIGRNGSGKSTLLKMMAGIYRPDAGEIVIDGRVSALIELGAGFHPDFSGRENVYINASILGMSRKRINEIFDDIVRFAELEEFIDNPVRTYSSGMFMRLGFSVAIHVDPDILLVDEVLAVGDESFGAKCRERMEAFIRNGKTILLVTHDLSQVAKWCDGAVWLDKGELKAIGKPERVIDAYLAAVSEKDNEGALAAEALQTTDESEESVNRWGDQTVTIDHVTITAADGAPRKVFGTGDPITVELSYTPHKPVVDPVVGVAIHKADGAHCYGANTDIERLHLPRLDRPGKVKIIFDRMELVEGGYSFSVAIHAKDGHAYDFHDQMYPFSVRSKIKDVGSFRPPHRWEIDGRAPIPMADAAEGTTA